MQKITQRAIALLLVLFLGFDLLTPASLAREPIEQSSATQSTVEIAEPSVPETENGVPFSLGVISAVNPLYEGIIEEPEAPEHPLTGLIPQSSEVFSSISGVGKELRTQMVNRTTDFVIAFRTEYTSTSLDNATIRSYTDQFFDYATQHTGKGGEGDYLRWSYGSWSCGIECTISKGTITYYFNYTLSYYTSAEQEKKLNARIEEVLASLDLEEKTEYQKIYAIYNYICRNVTYDNDHVNQGRSYSLQFTAYAALINGTAVCQGYSTLFYHMALDAGVETRVLSSRSLNHGWNLVLLDGKFYQLDSTWDSQLVEEGYRYLLRCSSEFGHRLNNKDVTADEYQSDSFCDAYPLSSTSYNGRAISGETENSQSWDYTPETRTLTIQGEGALPDYTADTVPWAECLPLVKNLSLSRQITSIGSYCFRDAALIQEFPISSALESIGEYAFYNCERLTEVNLPSSVQSIGKYAFGFLRKKGKPVRLSGFVLSGELDSEADRYAASSKLFFDADTKIDLTEEIVDFSITTPTLYYNASRQTPGISLLYDGKELDSGLDYTLSCQNHLNIGTASVTVTLTGRYSGTLRGTYEILPQTLKQAAVTLKTTSYTYNGKSKKPAVAVKLDGHTVSSENYTVSYKKNKEVGTASVVITGSNNCYGVVKVPFTINPAIPTLSSVKKSGSGKLTAKWTKVEGVSGYRVQYSTNSKFSSPKYATVKKSRTVSAKLSNLKKGKKYYVRVQSWQTVSDVKYYSKWSEAKSAKA